MTADGRTGLEVRARVAARGVDVDVAVGPDEVLAVLGPNGAGKSTLLALAAGLLRPDDGVVRLGGRELAGPGAWVPPHRRGVVLMTQDALLMPHLDVLANVAFGPRSAGATRRDAERRAHRWLERVGADELARRRPAELSGGQSQRVALARALAAEPRALLLDEPLAALDVASAPELRRLLREALPGRPAVVVTHDPLDVLALVDTVVVLDDGHVVERGPARQVLARPRSPFAARFADLDLLVGTATSDGVRLADGTHLVGMVDPDCRPGEPAVAVFRPAAVAVHLDPPGGSPRNVLAGTVTSVESRGAVVRLEVRAAGTGLHADVTVASAADLDLVPGRRVHLAVKATEVSVHGAGPVHGRGRPSRQPG